MTSRKTLNKVDETLDILENSLTRLIETSPGDDLGDVSSFEAPEDFSTEAFGAISKEIREQFSPCLKRILSDLWNDPAVKKHLIRMHPELREDYMDAITDNIDVYVADLVYAELLKTITHLKDTVDREKSYL